MCVENTGVALSVNPALRKTESFREGVGVEYPTVDCT